MTDDTMTEGTRGPGTMIDETKGLGTMTDGMRGPGTMTDEVVMIDESESFPSSLVVAVTQADIQIPTRREA